MRGIIEFTVTLVLLSLFSTALSSKCDIGIVGAGPGGVYAAWRMATSLPSIDPSEICIFEATNRIGGRTRPVNASDAPELSVLGPGQYLELGAYRYRPGWTPLTQALVENVFDIPTQCFDVVTPLAPTGSCPGAPTTYFLRGKRITAAQLSNSDNLPYFLDPSEQWGPGKSLSSKPNINTYVQRNAIPAIVPYLSNFPANNETARWENFLTIMNIVKNSTINGINPADIDVRTFIGNTFSEEFMTMDGDLFGNGGLARQNGAVSIYHTIEKLMKQAAGGPSTNRVIRDGHRGYLTHVERMLNEARARGVRIFYNYRLTAVEKKGSKVVLSFDNGETERVKSVILNLPYNAITALSRESDLFRESSEEFKTTTGSLFESRMLRSFLYYEDAWWVNRYNLTSGNIYTTEMLKELRYHNAPIQWDAANSRYRGFLMSGFVIGPDNLDFQSADDEQNLDVASPLKILRRDNVRDAASLARIHAAVKKVHSHLPDIDTIPEPTMGVLGQWITDSGFRGSAQIGPSKITPGNFDRTMREPIPGQPIYLVNLDYSGISGWAEWSYVMAEKVLYNYYGIQPMTWMSNAWYRANVIFDA